MPAKKPTSADRHKEATEIRELREAVENTRLDVARLEGRLDVIETFLKLDIQSFEPTAAQLEFAKRLGFNLPKLDSVTEKE